MFVNVYMKAGCLALYLSAIVSSFVALPLGLASILQIAAVAVLAAHTLELLIAFGSVRKHPGPLIDSVALTLLFGILHWQPLRKRS